VSPHQLAKVLSELARAGIVESVRGVGGGYRFVGNVRRLTLMDVVQTFEQPGLPEGGRREPGELTPVGRALGAVLSEIDEIAKATLSSITLTTMLRLMERQQRGPAESVARRKNNGGPARTRSSDPAHRPSRSRPRSSPATKA
jgi:Rrf2 family protein